VARIGGVSIDIDTTRADEFIIVFRVVLVVIVVVVFDDTAAVVVIVLVVEVRTATLSQYYI
jgi:hypothetical protein